MSTTTPTGQAHLADVASYADAVRRHLVGLSSDQVEDLTDGLEADLADALADPPAGAPETADGADLTARFGSPATYAEELRAAAGLPDAGVPHARQGVRTLLAAPFRAGARAARGGLDRLRERPAPVEEFLEALTPAVWLLRGWLLAQVVTAVSGGLLGVRTAGLPTSLSGWIVLTGLCVASVQWGRGRWQGSRWSRGLRVVATVVAVAAALPVFYASLSRDARYESIDQTGSPSGYGPAGLQDGVVVDGMAVSNLFVSDAAGNPLDGVQIFDDRGRPVRTTAVDGGSDQWSLPGVAEPWSFLSAQDKDGRALWNVYPLRGGPISSFEWNAAGQYVLVDGATPRIPPRPFAKAPAVTLPGAMTGTSAGAPDAATPAPTIGIAPGAASSAVPSSGATAASTGPTPST
jgi:hypothetical protein